MSAEIIEEKRLPDDLTEIGIDLPPEMSFEGWLATARFVRTAEKGWQWWLADLLVWADDHGLENEAIQALGTLGFLNHTLSNKKSIGRRFPKARRRVELSFGHHESVAFESEEAADTLLQRAVADKWTRDEIRLELQRYRETTATPANPAPRPHPGPQKRGAAVRRERMEAPRMERNLVLSDEQRLSLLQLCQEAIDEVAQKFDEVTVRAETVSPDKIAIAAAAAKDKFLTVIEYCEQIGIEPL